jgi:hypothetical protein
LVQSFPGSGGPLYHFANDLPYRARREARSVGETPDLVHGDFVETLASAEVQSELITGDIEKGRDEIISRREDRRAAIRVQQRPVFQVHVTVADQHGKNQPPNKFISAPLTRFGPQYRSDVGVASMPVLVIGEQTKDLREVLHMDAPRPGRTVKALDDKRVSFHPRGGFRQTPDVADGYEPDLGNRDAGGARQSKHRAFVLRYCLELCGWQLDDPGPAHTVSRDGQTARRLHDDRVSSPLLLSVALRGVE